MTKSTSPGRAGGSITPAAGSEGFGGSRPATPSHPEPWTPDATGGVELEAIAGALRVLRDQIAPGASDDELAYFAQVCHRLELSPFADEIVLIGRRDRRLDRVVHRHQITVAGRRAIAERQPEWAGSDGPMWCGRREDNGGELIWRELWDDDEHPPYAARTLVYRHDWIKPANGTCKWSEFAQLDSNGHPLPMWRQMPSHMLGKTSESLALKRAFRQAITVAESVPPYLGPGDLERDPGPPEVSPGGETLTPGDWRPTAADQADAHRIIGELDPDAVDRFRADWRIDDFGSWWPPDAVADALSRRPPS